MTGTALEAPLCIQGWEGPRYGQVSRKFPEAPVTQTLLRHVGRGPLDNVNICYGAKWDYYWDVWLLQGINSKTTKKKIIFVYLSMG